MSRSDDGEIMRFRTRSGEVTADILNGRFVKLVGDIWWEGLDVSLCGLLMKDRDSWVWQVGQQLILLPDSAREAPFSQRARQGLLEDVRSSWALWHWEHRNDFKDAVHRLLRGQLRELRDQAEIIQKAAARIVDDLEGLNDDFF